IIQARWVGPSAWLQAEFATSGTSVRWALRTGGRATQPRLAVGFIGYSMNPSGPGFTLDHRLSAGRLSPTVVPSVPPGTSSAPTRHASRVRAQQHSYPPQPLFTVLPSAIATGRNGRVAPSI